MSVLVFYSVRCFGDQDRIFQLASTVKHCLAFDNYISFVQNI
jgi:hypothetical protein